MVHSQPPQSLTRNQGFPVGDQIDFAAITRRPVSDSKNT